MVWYYSRLGAMVCILLHVILDGLDGPVARSQGTASAQGSLTDSMCDQIIVTASTICLVQYEYVAIIAGSIYIFTYAMVVGFAMVRNALQQPYSWVVRPRFLVFAWLHWICGFSQRLVGTVHLSTFCGAVTYYLFTNCPQGSLPYDRLWVENSLPLLALRAVDKPP